MIREESIASSMRPRFSVQVSVFPYWNRDYALKFKAFVIGTQKYWIRAVGPSSPKEPKKGIPNVRVFVTRNYEHSRLRHRD